MPTEGHHSPTLDWKVLLWVLPAVALGLWFGQVSGLGMAAIFSGVVSGLVALTGSRGSLRQSVQLAGMTGVILILLTAVSSSVAGIPLLAGSVFALIAFASSVASSAAPIGLLLSLVVSSFYLFATPFSLVLVSDQNTSSLLIVASALIGFVWGMLIVVGRGLFTLTTSPVVDRVRPADSRTLETMRKALVEFRRGPKDGVRRAIALGIAAYWFTLVPNHDSFIVLLTVSILLPVEGRVTILTGSYRLFGAYLSVGVALSLTYVLSETFVYVIAVGAIVYAIAVAARSTTHADAAIAISFLLFIGAPGADFGIYAGWRLVEAAAGFALALVAGYILWPRQPLTIVPVPEDLVAQSSRLKLLL